MLLMKVPETWDDRAPLDTDPFLNAFTDRARARITDIDRWRERVLERLRDVENIDTVLKKWRSSLPPEYKSDMPSRQEERLEVFFDFYYAFAPDNVDPDSAFRRALDALNRRRGNTGTSLRAATRQRPAIVSIPGEGTSSRAENTPSHKSAEEGSRVPPKVQPTSGPEELAASRKGKGRPPKVPKADQSINDKDISQKPRVAKRPADEPLPRTDKKRRLKASLGDTGAHTDRRLRKTKERMKREDASAARHPENSDRNSRLRPRAPPNPVEQPDRKAPGRTRQTKQESVERVLSSQDARDPDPVDPGPSAISKRTRSNTQNLDNNAAADAQESSKRKKRRKIPHHKSNRPPIPPSPEQESQRSKLRNTTQSIHRQAQTVPVGGSSSLRKRNPPVPEGAAETQYKPSPGSSTSKDTKVWVHKLRARGPISRQNNASSASTVQKPTGKGRPRRSSITAHDRETHPKAAPVNDDPTTKKAKPCLHLKVETISVNPRLPTPEDNDDELESISQFSSPLSSPPDSPIPLPAEPLPEETSEPGPSVAASIKEASNPPPSILAKSMGISARRPFNTSHLLSKNIITEPSASRRDTLRFRKRLPIASTKPGLPETPATPASPQPDSKLSVAPEPPGTVVDITLDPQEDVRSSAKSDSATNTGLEVVEPDAQAGPNAEVLLSPDLSGTISQEMFEVAGGNNPQGQGDSGNETEPISQFSSPLRTPPDVSIFLPAAIRPDLSDSEEDIPLARYSAYRRVPHAECEDMKTMTLVSDLPTMPSTASVPILAPAEPSHTLEMKPPLPKHPPMWAESRQEVCEGYDWFRSYQGGVYFADDFVKGYLLSGFPASRDRFEHDGRFIISHGGGRAESLHSSKGNITAVPATDQLAADKSVRALLNNYVHKRPLALLIDDKYALFPYDLGSKDVAYAVLGFYTVAYAWAEYQPAGNELGQVVRYKFAFRWCEEQGEPWWTLFPKNSVTPDLLGNKLDKDQQLNRSLEQIADASVQLDREHTDLPRSDAMAVNNADASRNTVPNNEEQGEEASACSSPEPCRFCGQESPKVFSISWACLNADCPLFWAQSGSHFSTRLPSNLAYEPSFLQLPKYQCNPLGLAELQVMPPVHELVEDPSVGATTDYHFTRGYHCDDCGRLSCRSQWEQWQCLGCQSIKNPPIPIRRAGDLANQPLPISFDYYFVNDTANIITCPLISYVQQGGRGYVQSFILPDGRGKIHHIQARTRASKLPADAIFTEYQVEAASGRMKFRRWPMRAHKCRGALLTNYFSHNAGEPYKYVGGDANTVPFEQAPAVCKARDLIQKRIKDSLGVSSTFNEVLSAAYMERQSMAFHSDNEVGLGPFVAGLSLGSPALMHFRLHARHDPRREQKGILLTVVLRHGDVLVMDGAGVQDFYEHTVVPNNFRIAATARQIGATHS